MGEAERDLAAAVQVAQVLNAGGERDVDGAGEGGAAYFAEFEAVAGGGELAGVFDGLLEGGDFVPSAQRLDTG